MILEDIEGHISKNQRKNYFELNQSVQKSYKRNTVAKSKTFYSEIALKLSYRNSVFYYSGIVLHIKTGLC